MKLTELINQYRNKLHNGDSSDKCSILLFALQLPSICGRINFPQTCQNTGKNSNNPNCLYKRNGKPWDRNLYKYWMKHHFHEFKYLIDSNIWYDDFIDDIYSLRCDLTHEGIVCNDKRIVFIPDGKSIIVDKDALYLSVGSFCERMFDAAYYAIEYNDIDISGYDDVCMDEDAYVAKDKELLQKYTDFWSMHSNEDKLLLTIHDNLFINDYPDKEGLTLKEKVEEFFDNNPDGTYEIDDFGRKYISLSADDKYIFEVSIDDSKYTKLICKFNRVDYDRMIQLRNEINQL